MNRSIFQFTSIALILAASFHAAADNASLHLLDAAGKQTNIPAANAKATVLVFVTPDCPIANRYAPVLHDLAASFSGRIAFFRVYAAPDTTAADVNAHEKAYTFNFPGLLDPEQLAVAAYGATCTPEAVVLDATGTMRYRGAIDDRYTDYGKYHQNASRNYLRDAIDAVLAGKPVPTERTKALGCFIPAKESKPAHKEGAAAAKH